MKKITFPLLLMLFLAACGKDPMPEPTKTRTRFSVLGDSYSAFEGCVDPESNDVFPYSLIGITDYKQMWWYEVADANGWKLEKNNSFSGSLICNCDHNEYYAPHSFIHRMDDLGNPDVIFVFGATNDVFNGADLGDYVYAAWTEEHLRMFRPGLSYLLSSLDELYPHAKVYLMVDMDLCSGGVNDSIRDAFIESMHVVADHYGAQCIDLYTVYKQRWHPNVYGMRSIARQVIDATWTGVINF